jgi:HEAT repeat protein
MLFALVISLLAFDPAATVRALKFDEAREGALIQLFELDYGQLEHARGAQMSGAIAQVILDENISLKERIIAVRALSHLQARQGATHLASVLRLETTPEGVALAREAARALYQLGARQHLIPGLGSVDPEVRAYAARSGAGGPALCAVLTQDPWPMVRAAAAEGVVLEAQAAKCLIAGLKDSDQDVRRAVVRGLGEARVMGATEALEKLVRRSKNPMGLRIDALFALGQMGAARGPKAILNHHLMHGGLERLAHGAVAALLVSRTNEPILVKTTRSKSPRVALAAARGLVEQRHPEAKSLTKALRARLKGRLRAEADRLLETFAAAPTLGTEMGRDAPEDAPEAAESLE